MGGSMTQWPRLLPAITLLGALAGCSDGIPLVAPTGNPVTVLAAKEKGGAAPATPAIEDALTRVLPSLAGGGSIMALKAGLEQVLAAMQKGRDPTALARALSEVERAIAQYQSGAGIEFQPDLDAVRLALYEAAS